MKCEILFSRKNKKSIITLSSAEFAHSIVNVKRQQGLHRLEKYLKGSLENSLKQNLSWKALANCP